MKNVFVVQETKLNIEPARMYGNFHVLCSFDDFKDGYDRLPEIIGTELKKHGLTEDDSLLCIGDPIAIGIAFHIIMTLTNDRINLLKWDRQTYSYIQERIEL